MLMGGAVGRLLVAILVPGLAAYGFQACQRLDDPPTLDPETMRATFALARAAAAGSAVPVANVGPLVVDQAVFVSLYGPDSEGRTRPSVGRWQPSADDPTRPLGEAVVRAAKAAGAELRRRGHRDLNGVVVKVDLAGPAQRLWIHPDWYLDFAVDPGREGLVAAQGEARAWFLPSWTVERDISASRAAVEALAELGPGGGALLRFRTTSFVGAEAPAPVVRANVWVRDPTRDDIRDALLQAGRYLAREVRDDGSYCYSYLALVDRCGREYNLLRHAGTTYSLFQIYALHREPALLASAERATRWLRQQVRAVDGDPSRAFLLEGDRAKLGAVGLALIALVEREEVLRDGHDRELMRRLAAFITSQQRADGYLASYFSWNGREVPEEESIYYPGEALLGLIRLYGIDPQPSLLATAQRSAEFLVKRRWRWGGVELYTPPDAWLAQALSELDAIVPADVWRDYAYEIVRVTELSTLRADEGAAADLVGAPSTGPVIPTTAPAGSRIEAASAVWRMARRRGETLTAARLRELCLSSAQFQLSQQFRPDNSYYLPNPARARGAIRASPIDGEVRIDYVQHNATALLGVLEMLQ
jgi:hypothetical protein